MSGIKMRTVFLVLLAVGARSVSALELVRSGQNPKPIAVDLRFSQLGETSQNPSVLTLLMALMGLLNPLTGGPPATSQQEDTLGPGGPSMTFPPVSQKVQDFIDKAVEQAKKDAIAQLKEFNANRDLDNDVLKVAESRLKKFWYIGQCRRDYQRNCPIQWIEVERGNGACEPPMTYEGPCGAANLKGSSSQQKEDFAWRCQVQWPCLPAPKKNYDAVCPSQWINIDRSLCLAPHGYSGACSAAMDFRNFSKDEKVDWAARCSVEWPSTGELKMKISKGGALKAKKLASKRGGPVSEDGHIKTV